MNEIQASRPIRKRSRKVTRPPEPESHQPDQPIPSLDPKQVFSADNLAKLCRVPYAEVAASQALASQTPPLETTKKITQRFVEVVTNGKCRSFADAASHLAEFGEQGEVIQKRLQSVVPALLYEPLKKLLKTLTVEVALPEGFDEIWSAVRAVHTTARVRGWYCVATFRFLDSDLIPVAEVLMDLARYIPDRETLQWVQLGLTDPSSPSAVPTVGRHNPLLRVAAELRRTRVLADRLETFPHSVMLRRGPHFVLVGETPSNLWAWAESLRAAMCEAGLLFLPTGLQADVREAPIHIEGFLVDFADGHARCRLGQYAYTFLQITLHGASFRAPLTQTQARDLLFEWTNSYALGLTDLVCRPPESPESQEILRQIRMILAQAGCPEDVVESLVAQMPGWIQNQMSCFMFDGATYSWLL